MSGLASSSLSAAPGIVRLTSAGESVA
jgi:hypothetical protein